MFPESCGDPRCNLLGTVGTLIGDPVTRMNDGRLCCATRTGVWHAGSGDSKIGTSFSIPV